jgi:hypothetical protein
LYSPPVERGSGCAAANGKKREDLQGRKMGSEKELLTHAWLGDKVYEVPCSFSSANLGRDVSSLDLSAPG